ncbi:MAG: phosphoadenosine phosphosulfate reductase [Pseudomonadota bacterium]
MEEDLAMLDASLAGLDLQDWKERIIDIADDLGHYQSLGERHFSTFLEFGRTLLVTFETVDSIRAQGKSGHPLGFGLARKTGWSHLSFISIGDTWFREDKVYRYVDRLIDDGFFETFDRVIFYGAQSCGYAAAAFSVAAPGATVIAVQPQATLDPALTEWDTRFPQMRRTSFCDRYGYAPDMVEAADRAFVIYDPYVIHDAMHAALFRGSNVEKLRLRCLGDRIEHHLTNMGILSNTLYLAAEDTLTRENFFALYRIRRKYRGFLLNLLARTNAKNRIQRSLILCEYVTARFKSPAFRKRLEELRQQLADARQSEILVKHPRAEAGAGADVGT